MPLYEYRCDDCQHRFEVLQRMGQGASDLVCPSCGGEQVAKMLSTFAAATAGQGSTTATAPAGGCCRGTPT